MSERTDEEIRARDLNWSFSSSSKYHLVGRGDIYMVPCPIRCYEFEWIINKEVTVDGKEFKVVDVERFSHLPPWQKNESIGLLVHSMDYQQKDTK